MLSSFTLSVYSQIKIISKADYEAAKQEYDQLKAQIDEKQAKMREAQENQDPEFYNKYKAEYDELVQKIKGPQSVLEAYMAYRKVVSGVARLYTEGQQAFRLKRYQQAATKYDESIKQGTGINDPEVKDILVKASYQMGLSLVRQKKYNEAIASYESIKTLDPQSYYSYYGLGAVYNIMRRNEEAVANYRRAIELNPSHLGIRYSLARVQFNNLKKPEEALKTFEELFASAGDNGGNNKATLARSYHLQGRIFHDLRKFNEAIDALKKSLEYDNTNYQSYYFIADSYYTLRKYQDAINYSTDCLKYKRGYGGAYLVRGRSYKKMGDETKALAEFNKAKNDRLFQKNALYEIDLIKNKDKYINQ